LEDALKFLSRPEKISDGPGSITKQLLIDRAPLVLVVQLKRFVFDPSAGQTVKIHKHIAFPERLELAGEDRTAGLGVYRLYGVVYHLGRSASGGHYTCHVRRSLRNDDFWYRFDDESSTKDPEAVVFAPPKSGTAYLLFYVRHKRSSNM